MSKDFAVLNSGSNEITAVAARWSRSGDYSLEGFCHAHSRGLSKGVVTDVTAAADSISSVMNKLRERTGRRITDIYTGISSSSVNVVPDILALSIS